MKLKYIYTLLTLVLALNFTPVIAQQAQHPAKKTTKKPGKKSTVKKPAPKKSVAKPVAAPVAKKPVVVAPKADAKNLGDAIKAADDATKKTDATKSDDSSPGGNLFEEIVVTTAYKPVLADAVKIRRNPDLEDKIPFKAPLTYTPVDKRLEKNEEIKPLSAMKIPAEKDSALMPDYIKLGVGNLKTTYGEAYITNGRDPALQIGGYLKHFDQSGTIYKQNQDKGSAGVFGKSINDENTLSGRIDYNYNRNYFFGYDMTKLPPVNFNPAQQHTNIISAEGEIAKNYKDVENDFTYAVKLKGYAFSDAFHARENNVVLSGFLNETIHQFYAGITGSADFSTQNDSLYSYNNSILRVNPYLKFQGNDYKVDVGVNMVDEFGFSSNFYLFPTAKGELQVIPKYVRLFVEVKGDVNKTSIRDFSELNPFIGPNIAITNSVDKLDLAAGLKGTLAPALAFKADIFRNSVRNMPLLVSNFTSTFNKFAVIYDFGVAQVNGFNGELDYKPSTDLNIFGRVEFRDYHLATQGQAWNLPKFKLTAGTAIQITDKVKITGTLLFRGSAYNRDVDQTKPVTTLSSFADLSGGVEYKVSKRIFIFGKVNNILNSTNQTWVYYPDYGFNIFGGAGLSF